MIVRPTPCSSFDRTPAVVTDVVVPLRQWLIDLLWVGMVFSLVRRWRAAPPLQKRAMGPVVVLGTVMGALQIAFYAAREFAAPARTVETLGSAWALCIAGLAAAFLLGLFRRRLLLAGALGRLGGALRDSANGVQVHDALATALSDPTLELLYERRRSRRLARCPWTLRRLATGALVTDEPSRSSVARTVFARWR